MRSALLLACLSVLLIGALSCNIETASSCSSGTKFLGIANDTGGYNNAHVENYTNTNYGNSLCCDITGDTLTHSCGTTLFKLSAETNAHVEQSNNSAYTINACLSAPLTNLSCSYVDGNCGGGTTCVLSFANADNGANDSNAHVGNCTTYTRKLCCGGNTLPSVPVLITPTAGNTSVFDRFTYFNWSSTDPNGDTITYFWNISSPAGCAAIPEKNTTNNYYTSTDKLCVDKQYNWTVKACDAEGCSAYASPSNFTITSVVGITFVNANVNFTSFEPSSLTVNSTANTSAGSPAPLVYNNSGNVDARTETKANGDLWVNQPLNTEYFRFADENSSSWTNWNASYQTLFSNLTYPGGVRELEVLVTVPIAEPAGAKNTTVSVLGITLE